ncbi:hypothetical protein A1O3_04140 [Capronia epimyces CBS 606.96]|uniref:Uncharacterized protein n=1 Tax=Capronia epimyces CBS 606.96 TaxID=1182542 RepID=W9YD42_9EURO|nr:uncharacterized protein A1O3_04140 [Capronia epimyces CBS 606.96]EXJ87181.1 hypothetical protein A1O3_04140 [Capronia epimyces CBS 606.96]
MSQEDYMQEIWWRLKYDWEIAEAIGDKLTDFANDPNIQTLRNSPHWDGLVQRQSRLVLLLTQLLLAKGETKLSVLEILSRHGDGLGKSILELVVDREREKHAAEGVRPSRPSFQGGQAGPRRAVVPNSQQAKAIPSQQRLWPTYPPGPSTLFPQGQQPGAGQSPLQSWQPGAVLTSIPAPPAQLTFPSQQPGPSHLPGPYQGYQAPAPALPPWIEPPQPQQPEQPFDWNTFDSPAELVAYMKRRHPGWSPIVSPSPAPAHSEAEAQEQEQAQVLSARKYDTLPPPIIPPPPPPPPPLQPGGYRAIQPRPPQDVIDAATIASQAAGDPTSSGARAQSQGQAQHLGSVHPPMRHGKQPESATKRQSQSQSAVQPSSDDPPVKGAKRLPRGRKG